MATKSAFDITCRQCERLATFLDEVKAKNPTYFCKPVPPFGDENAKLIVVGLAPGMHGANQTGRPFTGDYAGVLLYETLHKYGFATKSQSVSAHDDLQLVNCRITNAVKCLPPDNKPLPAEIATCNQFLAAELNQINTNSIILALGNVAHLAVLKAFGLKIKDYKFGHAARYMLPNGLILVDSYHCSRYNTQTKRLTEAMFHSVFAMIQQDLT
ncbi:uracil-DNA glycosylase [Methylotenera sp.]|uniref:uracil-DNA glycosylase n=1 Tax=Methylotenera sp. TaxID=2051956 RepID=UPI002715683B|nr:uracil-DNA glycosylase [Methylotenera sp.]MDO9205653.1 uracil-DNA glycosylase [Methylotenera sp.]MDP3307687.1 uracil-DNA glycosylase [Methylotenera sp.]MDP3819618.1 uracil-DNA glycosylase [Methylotenera sp.]MDZ4210482.1 uracil-DNA glycosylase [Methylotenera sp.]